jgi:hypothetical protein
MARYHSSARSTRLLCLTGLFTLQLPTHTHKHPPPRANVTTFPTTEGNGVDGMNIDMVSGDEENMSLSRNANSRKRAYFVIAIPTLAELGRTADEYEDFGSELAKEGDSDEESSVCSRVSRVVEEVERENGTLWYLAKFNNGKLLEVSISAGGSIVCAGAKTVLRLDKC